MEELATDEGTGCGVDECVGAEDEEVKEEVTAAAEDGTEDDRAPCLYEMMLDTTLARVLRSPLFLPPTEGECAKLLLAASIMLRALGLSKRLLMSGTELRGSTFRVGGECEEVPLPVAAAKEDADEDDCCCCCA